MLPRSRIRGCLSEACSGILPRTFLSVSTWPTSRERDRTVKAIKLISLLMDATVYENGLKDPRECR